MGSPVQPTPGHRRYRDALVILVLALGIRVLYVADFQADPFAHDLVSNAGLYHQLGQQIARGEGLSITSGAQPLYPHALGVVYRLAGPSPLAIQLLQALLGGLTAALVTVLASRLGGRSAGLVAGLAWSLFWPSIYYAGELLPDTLGCALIVAAAVPLERAVARGGAARWVAGALALGLAGLIKPNALLLAPWPVVAVLLVPGLERPVRRRRAATALLVPGAAVLLLAAGTGLYAGDHGGGSAHFAAKSLWDGNHAGADGINPFMEEYEQVLRWEVWDDPEDSGAIARAFRADLWSFVREQPGAFLGLQVRKAVIFVSHHEVGNNATIPWRRARSPVLAPPVWLGFGALLVLAAPGLAVTTRRWREQVLPLGWLLTWSASIVAILVAGRYRLPAAALLCCLAGLGVHSVLRGIRTKDRRALVVAAALAAGAAAVTFPDHLGLRDYRIASVLQIEAQVLERAGDLAGAEERYLAGTGLARQGASLQRSYGLFLVRHGRVDEGLEQMGEAVERAPDDASLHKDLGAALRHAGRRQDALESLERARELDPEDGGIHYNQGLVWMDLGRPEEAQKAFTSALEHGADEGDVWLMRGVARAQLQHYEEAEADLREALTRMPEDCRVRANLGLLYRRTGREAEAREVQDGC